MKKAAGITGGFQTERKAVLATEALVRACATRISTIQTIMGFLGVTLHLLPFLVSPANAISEAGSGLTNGAAPQPAFFGGPGFLRPLLLSGGLFFGCHCGAGGK